MSLQHFTLFNQKQTPSLCFYCFLCHRDRTTRSNTTILWSPRRAVSRSWKKGKWRTCPRFVCVSLMISMLVAFYSLYSIRSRVYALWSTTKWNPTSANTGQSLGLFINAVQCPQESRSNNPQTGSGNYPIWQGPTSSGRRSYDWSSFC